MRNFLWLVREVVTIVVLTLFVGTIVVWFAILAPNAPKDIAAITYQQGSVK